MSRGFRCPLAREKQIFMKLRVGDGTIDRSAEEWSRYALACFMARTYHVLKNLASLLHAGINRSGCSE